MESTRVGGIDASALIAAFLETRRGCSADRVVADPQLNQLFLSSCLKKGLKDQPVRLNLALFQLRKSGKLDDYPTVNQTRIRNQDEYRFAAEIAARFLQRRDSVSLDSIICDPELAAEFDMLAQQLCPGYTSLEYRWAVLSLRKQRNFRPQILSSIVRPDAVIRHQVAGLDVACIPAQQGIYHFVDADGLSSLYVGEAQNLRIRLRKHLDHSDNRGLARWLWERGIGSLWLELQVLSPDTPTRVRRALESELIATTRPVFNAQGM